MPLGIGGQGNFFGLKPVRSTMGPTNDPFYNVGGFQQDKNFDWTKTPLIGGPTGYIEQNQDVGYNRWLTQMGIGQSDNSEYANWLRRKFQETQLGWKTGLAEDPTLTYQGYLQRLGADYHPVSGVNALRRQWESLAPVQRGENVSRFGGPMRTISDI